MVLGRRCGERRSCVLDKPSVWYLGDSQGEDLAGGWVCEQLCSITHSAAKASLRPALPALISKVTSLLLRPKSLEAPLTFSTAHIPSISKT